MSLTIGINGPTQDKDAGTICTIDVMCDPPLKRCLSFMVATSDPYAALKSIAETLENIIQSV